MVMRLVEPTVSFTFSGGGEGGGGYLESPGKVGISEGKNEIGHVRQHRGFVHEVLRGVVNIPVHRYVHSAHRKIRLVKSRK